MYFLICLFCVFSLSFFFFFFNDTATTEIYTLSLHDALPSAQQDRSRFLAATDPHRARRRLPARAAKSEEQTSELQSHHDLVCRLLLEKKKYARRATCPSKKKTGNREKYNRDRKK